MRLQCQRVARAGALALQLVNTGISALGTPGVAIEIVQHQHPKVPLRGWRQCAVKFDAKGDAIRLHQLTDQARRHGFGQTGLSGIGIAG